MTITTFAQAIVCQNVSHTYGRGASAVVAVHGVTCSVPLGGRLALTGPSGSGKSTLLHMMAGLALPTDGSILWPELGANPAGRSDLVGVVFQGPSLIPALDVIENVGLPLVLNNTSDADARSLAMAALQKVGVAELADKLPEELSGGQAQRVAIARVLAAGPTLILADEPTGQLDRATGVQVIEVLLRAADELGATLIVSTHDPLIAERLDTSWQMRDGALVTLVTQS